MKKDFFRWTCALCAGLSITSVTWAQPPELHAPTPIPAAPSLLMRGAAVQNALQHNPALMTVRQQRGYATAACVLAHTYPFNPVYTGYVTGVAGPGSAGISNTAYQEHYVTLELELCHQGQHRKAAAAAVTSRIEWEIAQQEMAVSIAVIRAYNTVLYRQQKLALLEEGVQINEVQFDQLVKASKAKALDVSIARADLESSRAQLNQARTILAIARSELRKLMGTLDDTFIVAGTPDVPLPAADQTSLTQLALSQRPDLHARQSAVQEAEAQLKLIQSNRFGNPSVGPYYEYDPTRVNYVGGRISMPLAVFNRKKGEILKAETDVAKVSSEVRQLELQASLDVQAALNRLANARQWLTPYQTEIVPSLLKAKDEIEKLFAAKDPSVDLLRVFAIQRGYLKANDNLLDARYEVSQAEADLALAVAEPTLALGPCLAGEAIPAPK